MPDKAIASLSVPQRKVLQTLAKHRNQGFCNMGGHKRAPVLSACRALVRKGFALNFGGGRFCISESGLEIVHLIKD
jgi:hypothetical protein